MVVKYKMKKLVILCNEKVSNDKDNNFYSLNADLQILPDGLNSKYDVFCIFRKLKNYIFKYLIFISIQNNALYMCKFNL